MIKSKIDLIGVHFPTIRCPKFFDQEVKRVSYSLSRDSHSNCIYTKRDEYCIKEDINSYRDSCTLASQLARLAMLPADRIVSTLHQTEVFNGDFSAFPRDLMEYIEQRKSLEKAVPNIDELIRTHSYDDILKLLGFSDKAAEPTPVPEPTPAPPTESNN